jgi:hypothetical protein
MKTFSDEALAALQRGDAIVSASVEIIPNTALSYSTVGIIDLDSVTNGATGVSGGLTAGIESSGFDPADTVRVTLPTGQTYVAWSPWGRPSPANATDPILSNRSGSATEFQVIPDGVTADVFSCGDGEPVVYDGYEAARAAFGARTFTGASSYIFYIQDSPVADNTGGLSIRVERGIRVVGTGDPIRLWGGYGAADLPSDEGTSTFQGIGDRGLINQSAGAIGGSAQNLTLSLSGIEPAALELGGRIRSDADQRLVSATDGFYRVVSAAPKKTLYWGGKRPSVAGSAVGGG